MVASGDFVGADGREDKVESVWPLEVGIEDETVVGGGSVVVDSGHLLRWPLFAS